MFFLSQNENFVFSGPYELSEQSRILAEICKEGPLHHPFGCLLGAQEAGGLPRTRTLKGNGLFFMYQPNPPPALRDLFLSNITDTLWNYFFFF